MICKSCGKVTFQETDVCQHCGKQNNQSNEGLAGNSTTAKQKQKSGQSDFITLLSIVGVAFSIWALFFYEKTDLRKIEPESSASNVSQSQSVEQTTTTEESKTIAAYTNRHEETIGTIALNDGRIMEYFTTSPSLLCYEMKSYTKMQMDKFNGIYTGQYVYFYGEITDVYDDGTVAIHCIDEEVSKELDLSWPIMASVCLHTNESPDVLVQLSQGDLVVAIGILHEDSYSSMLGIENLDLVEGELLVTDYFSRIVE